MIQSTNLLARGPTMRSFARLVLGSCTLSLSARPFSHTAAAFRPALTTASFVGSNSSPFLSTSSPFLTTTRLMATKPGVSSPEELKAFVEKAGNNLLVVDVRNPDPEVEPGDQKSLAVAPLPDEAARPKAVSLIYDRNTSSMPLPDVPKDTPIITHCGGGGRGQKAKEFLEKNGFTNVLNGGGPKEKECWSVYGNK